MANLLTFALLDRSGKNRGTCEAANAREAALKLNLNYHRRGLGWTVVQRTPAFEPAPGNFRIDSPETLDKVKVLLGVEDEPIKIKIGDKVRCLDCEEPKPEQAEPYEFKKGDRVRVTEGCPPFYSKGDIGIKVDDGYVDFSGQGNKHVYKDGRWFASDSRLELVEPAFPFKVGDKISGTTNVGTRIIGWTIAEINHDYAYPIRAMGPGSVRGMWCYTEGVTLDPVKAEEPKKAEPKTAEPVPFKVGDRVTRNRPDCSVWKQGMAGKVIEVDPSRRVGMNEGNYETIRVEWDASLEPFHKRSWYDPASLLPEVPKVYVPKIGDRVRVKASVKTPEFGWGSVKAGDIGVVQDVRDTRVSIDFPAQSWWNATKDEIELAPETPKQTELEEAQDRIAGFEKSHAACRELLGVTGTREPLAAALNRSLKGRDAQIEALKAELAVAQDPGMFTLRVKRCKDGFIRMAVDSHIGTNTPERCGDFARVTLLLEEHIESMKKALVKPR